MASQSPLFVRAATAAQLLDMSLPKFRDLVAAGSLPPPTAHDRWDVEDLVAAMRGSKPATVAELDL